MIFCRSGCVKGCVPLSAIKNSLVSCWPERRFNTRANTRFNSRYISSYVHDPPAHRPEGTVQPVNVVLRHHIATRTDHEHSPSSSPVVSTTHIPPRLPSAERSDCSVKSHLRLWRKEGFAGACSTHLRSPPPKPFRPQEIRGELSPDCLLGEWKRFLQNVENFLFLQRHRRQWLANVLCTRMPQRQPR